jgi:hypothetical protein
MRERIFNEIALRIGDRGGDEDRSSR